MGITSKINRFIIANWNPGDLFFLNDIQRVASEKGITSADSTIRRSLQEIRDMETIDFYDNNGR